MYLCVSTKPHSLHHAQYKCCFLQDSKCSGSNLNTSLYCRNHKVYDIICSWHENVCCIMDRLISPWKQQTYLLSRYLNIKSVLYLDIDI